MSLNVTVRTSLSATSLEPQIRREIQAVDPDLPIFNVRTMNEVIDGSLASRRFSAELVGVFAVVALLLASVGLYGLLAYMQEEVESLREMAGPGALGNLTLAVEDARSELTWISLERLGQDLRYAVRILVKNFSFTVLCVLTLALGIGATSTIVSWINGTLLNAIPGAQRTRDIVSLTRGDLSDSPTPPYSYPDLLDLKRQNTSFVGLLGYHNEPMGLTGNGRPVRVWGTYVTADYFHILAVVPAMLPRCAGTRERRYSSPHGSEKGRLLPVVIFLAAWHSLQRMRERSMVTSCVGSARSLQ